MHLPTLHGFVCFAWEDTLHETHGCERGKSNMLHQLFHFSLQMHSLLWIFILLIAQTIAVNTDLNRHSHHDLNPLSNQPSGSTALQDISSFGFPAETLDHIYYYRMIANPSVSSLINLMLTDRLFARNALNSHDLSVYNRIPSALIQLSRSDQRIHLFRMILKHPHLIAWKSSLDVPQNGIMTVEKLAQVAEKVLEIEIDMDRLFESTVSHDAAHALVFFTLNHIEQGLASPSQSAYIQAVVKALHWSSFFGFQAPVKRIFDDERLLKAVGKEWVESLVLASANGRLGLLKLLMSSPYIQRQLSSADWDALLLYGVSHGRVDVAQFLLTPVYANQMSMRAHGSALVKAAKKGYLPIMQEYLLSPQRLALLPPNDVGSALKWAVKKNRKDMVTLLLSHESIRSRIPAGYYGDAFQKASNSLELLPLFLASRETAQWIPSPKLGEAFERAAMAGQLEKVTLFVKNTWILQMIPLDYRVRVLINTKSASVTSILLSRMPIIMSVPSRQFLNALFTAVSDGNTSKALALLGKDRVLIGMSNSQLARVYQLSVQKGLSAVTEAFRDPSLYGRIRPHLI